MLLWNHRHSTPFFRQRNVNIHTELFYLAFFSVISSVIILLQYYVLFQILYKNRATDEGLKVLSIRDCTKDNDKEGWCDFEVLETLMQDAVVTNYDEECYSPSISAADIPNEASC